MRRLLASLLYVAACSGSGSGATGDAAAAPVEATPTAPTRSEPVRLAREELVPGVAAVVYDHRLDTGKAWAPAWTFVTEGMVASSLPEIVVTVLRPPGRDAADFPRELLPTLAGMATGRGPIALRPGISAVIPRDAPPLLDGTELRAIYFLDGDNGLDVPLPNPTVAAVFMTHDEHTLAQELGFVRWAGRLGRDASAFPTPWWTYEARAPVLTQAERDASLLAKVRHRYLVGTSVIHQPNSKPSRLTVRIEPVAAAEFKVMARDYGDGFALLTGISELADAYLVWDPGQTSPMGISREDDKGERIGGNFLVLLTTPDSADEFRMIEDGFSLALKPATWERLTTAIAAAAPLELNLGDTIFVLEWPTTTHVDPTGVRYEANGAWTTYTPDGTTPSDPNRMLANIVLLTPEDMLAQRITVAVLADYMKKLEAAVQEHEKTTAGTRPAHNLVVDVTLAPGRPPTIALRSDRPAELGEHLPPLTTRLGRIAAPTPIGEVHFLLQIAAPAPAAKAP